MTVTMTPPDQTQTPKSEPPKNKPKGFPSPVKAVLRPILFLAIAAHGLLLIVPLPSNKKLEIPDDKETQIKITQIPPAKPSPKLSQAENKPGSGGAADGAGAGSDDSSSESSSSSSYTSSRAASSSSSDYSSDSGSDSSSSSYSSRRSSAGIGTDTRTYSGSFASFPHYTPADQGCYGRPDCYTVKGKSLDAVDQYFAKVLKDKDFGIKPGKNESGVRTYKLQGGLEERYLSIIADGQNTLYLVAARPVDSLQALKESGAIFTTQPTPSPNGQNSSTTTPGQTSVNISANSTSSQPLVEVPEPLYALLDELIPEQPLPDTPEELRNVKPAYFAQPNLFFKVPVVTSPGQQQASTQPVPLADDAELVDGLDTAYYLLGIEPDKFYVESLSEKLSQLFESVKKVGEFGGGALYELKQEKKPTLYLNLLSVQKHPSGKEGTIVVLWTRDPRPPASSVTGKPLSSPSTSASPSPTN